MAGDLAFLGPGDGIAVLGPGGVGGFLAAALDRAGQPVTIVARPETAATIASDGLRVESVRLGDFEARPAAVDALDASPVVLFVATKAGGLRDAMDRVRGEPSLVVPLLNGLDHLAVLRERWGDRVVAGTIRIESDRPAPGRIVQTSPFLRIDMASDDPARRIALGRLVVLLAGAEVPAKVGRSEADVMWTKLVRLNALACTTSASDELLGFIRSDPEWAAALQACVTEATAVAHAQGAGVSAESVMGELRDAHETLGSSMQRDIAAGREPELDQIPGAVLRAAGRSGLSCPTIARLTLAIAQRAGIEPPEAARVAD
jgi:2-dehydropantoate 2-reductase